MEKRVKLNGKENNKFVNTVFTCDLVDKEFLIPIYQRGYRWEKKHVKKLLDDFSVFLKEGSEKNYSLQPIVINKRRKSGYNANDYFYSIIDGQQRLTTIWLIAKYLKEKQYKLHFESKNRNATIEQFDNKKKDVNANADVYHLHNVFEAIEEWFKKNKVNEKSIKDLLFSKTSNRKCSLIWYEPFGEEGDDISSEIEVFTRFNKGKIPLTDSELIKALFLMSKIKNHGYEQRIIAEKWDEIERKLQDENFWYFLYNKDEKQLELSKFQRMDYILKVFILKKEMENKEYKSKELNEYCEKLNEKDEIFLYFNEKYETKKNDEEFFKLWSEILNIYYLLCEWYNDLRLYHRIGFLLSVEKHLPEIKLAELLLEYYRRSNCKDEKKERKKSKSGDEENVIKKSSFNTKVIEKIKELILESIRLKKEQLDEYEIKSGKKKDLENIFPINDRNDEQGCIIFEKDISKTATLPILLLYNIETIIKQHTKNNPNNSNDDESKNKYEQNNDIVFDKFSFYYFKKEKWNIEHINPWTEKSEFEIKERENILNSILYYVNNNKKFEDNDIKNLKTELKKHIDKISNKLSYGEILKQFYEKQTEIRDFSNIDSLINEIVNKTGDEWTEDDKNKIWNYCLLDENTNKSYGNSPFFIKRKTIIEKDQGMRYYIEFNKDEDGLLNEKSKDGTSSFIPICTKKIFLKYNSKNINDPFVWSKNDAKDYVNDMRKKLKDYFD